MAEHVESHFRSTVQERSRIHSLLTALRCWVDGGVSSLGPAEADHRIDWPRVLPFIGLHVACVAVFWVDVSAFAVAVAVAVAIALYALRMFAFTGFYHRCFNHRAFKTSRVTQFVFAAIAAMSAQRGPLWWAAHHRHHHRHSDQRADLHSAVRHGWFQSHMGWFLTRGAFAEADAVEFCPGHPAAEARRQARYGTRVAHRR